MMKGSGSEPLNNVDQRSKNLGIREAQKLINPTDPENWLADGARVGKVEPMFFLVPWFQLKKT
jgi:hypothetical protein